MVLDEVWRRFDGVEPLSGPHGGPLRRTVKLILDPLVIRPVQHPLCAGPILTADGATLLATRMHAAADVLRATAGWFTLLKQVRRALRITEGNPQDLYFQRCFELATTSGAPDAVRDRAIAEAALRDIHEFTAGRTTQALKEYLTDGARGGELTALIDIAWGRRPVAGPTGDHTLLALALLEACAAARLGYTGDDGQAEFDRLVAAHAGTHTGIRLWHNGSAPTAAELGLTAHPLPQAPALGVSASKATLGLPFDRTIYERVFTALQASSERAELPPIPELVTTEIARSCSPWALLDESLRVAASTGRTLALGLRPIGTTQDTETDGARTTAHRVINGRWQREAYVLQARRLAVSVGPNDGPLAAIAAELRTPWRSYLRRLWVRLHGRDVREAGVYEPDELWDLLDGVARSVMLDHRMRVKQALSLSSLVSEPDSAESRAS
ncbi:hypothetical protein OG874_37085 [Nocardia sp. NBC_00565]|uniref:hypothetical protein n=1 Tax=Nocardia sp. NBC_00565 TaxID=2975993 RepID=UPI002E810DD6|nr:hypothetical protein [Nocardia sp. NBC_00565]WUC08217.1 hypothetical protein OG874_37085 [Nocardia sp. NBC_00565]